MILGSLELVREVGRGMAGEIVEMRDPATGTHLIVKRMRPQVQDLVDLVRFKREASLMAGLHHRDIMPILHVEADARPPYFVMPCLAGETLASRLGKGSLRASLACLIARDVCCGLVEAHRHGIVHRDVKPANIFIEASGRSVVFDFGLARLLDGDGNITSRGALLGTPNYMSPEQCRGEPATASADVYALGVVLFESLLGKNPFAGPDVVETLQRQLEQTPRRLDALLPSRVGEELGELVDRMLAKAAANRPSAERCLETLAGLVRVAETRARTATSTGIRPTAVAHLVDHDSASQAIAS